MRNIQENKTLIALYLFSLMLHSPMKYVRLDTLSVDSTREGIIREVVLPVSLFVLISMSTLS